MDEMAGHRSGERSLRTRLGIAALNLIVPGLSLIRLGDWRRGIMLLLAPFLFLALFTFGQGHFPVVGYYSAILALVLAVTMMAMLYIVPIAMTWSRSRWRAPLAWWSRWYAITAIAIVILLAEQAMLPLARHFYHGFYLPGESMAPTAEKNDKVIADMRWRGPLKRGDIVIFQGPDNVRISRVAAIGGDRIAMRDGVPIVNGAKAVQTIEGRRTFMGYGGAQTAMALTERLPSEAGRHEILDAGPGELDNTEEVMIPKGYFLVLGDNRDRSADSRVPPALGGIGMVPLNAIIGRAMYIYWSDDHDKIGRRLDR